MQRAIAIEPYSSSYEYISSLYRTQRRFTEALGAANQAVKLDEDSADAQFERACSLAQLGRKREALAALKRMLEIDPEAVFDPEERDLQPLAAMPEFKAMREKMKEAGAPAEKVKPAETRQEKKDKTKPCTANDTFHPKSIISRSARILTYHKQCAPKISTNTNRAVWLGLLKDTWPSRRIPCLPN